MNLTNEESAALLLETVPRVMRLIRTEMRELAKGKFTVPQFRILNRIRKGPINNRDLAQWMGVTPATMSRMIDGLEAKNLLKKVTDPKDRRIQVIALTALGSRETERIRRITRSRFSDRIAELTSEQKLTLSQGLQVLSEVFLSSEN